ncbi:TVP38/TMEM64 family protein [Aphanothece hegewaldii CCALA 016]|uniref:TVP38/TMEM64 family membrane protein n=1 Tax=Aphanothece hegewaldii CCALA 016 TaxID=2107694 RepID=A0A2T1LTV8_9CHRO|nr:TVP38/TMEM64 family protein [Aphanothece hegewaldii]PSF34558.1 TVP38/TMEM64 family protein [Aphanothece hegewaldii CCALA 016]
MTIVATNYLGLTLSIQNGLQGLLEWIDGLGIGGYFAFTFVYIVASILLLSGAILTLGAGAIYGVVKGSLLVIVASNLAAISAFLAGRYLARGWVSKLIDKQPRFKAIDEAVAQEGWKIVGLTRLSPLFPFVFLNYAFGLTQISLKDYILASCIGMLPGTIMFVYIGSLVGDIATLGTGGREKTSLEWGLYIVGLVATVVVTVYVTKISKKALDTQMVSQNENKTLK